MKAKKAIIGGCLIALCATTAFAWPTSDESQVPEIKKNVLQGYLVDGPMINSIALVPPPPREGSPRWEADKVASLARVEMKDSPVWALAERDSHHASPEVANTFSCALGVLISKETTPNLNILLRRTLGDAAWAGAPAKDYYQRLRPFLTDGEAICQAGAEESLKESYSYPSGHASYGYTWALVLSQVAPEKHSQIMQRGYDLGQQRVYCGAHWQSDVDAGRLVGAAVFAELQDNTEYLEQLAAARQEYREAIRDGNFEPDCVLEEQAQEQLRSMRDQEQRALGKDPQ